MALRPADFQSVDLHVRHARFTARVVHVRGSETTLAVPRGVPAAAHPLPADAEMSFEHERQIVMLSGTLLGGDDVSARFRGVSFVHLDVETQQRLDAFVVGVRHQLAQRFARAGG